MGIDEIDLGISDAVSVVCPLCGAAYDAYRQLVIDLDRGAARLAHAVDGSLQRTYCPHCIGPGVDVGGGFLLARRADGKVQIASFMPLGAREIMPATQALHERLRQHLSARGGHEVVVEFVGSRLFDRPGDIHDFVDDCWPGLLRHRHDPAMLDGPLIEFLNAPSPTLRAELLRAHPDLARPNVESFLGFIVETTDGERKSHALAARRFVDQARRDGLAASIQAEQAQMCLPDMLSELPPELVPAIRDFVESSPYTEADFAAWTALGRSLGLDLAAQGLDRLAAEVFTRLGDRHHRRLGSERAHHLLEAISAYGEALRLLPPALAEGRCGLLLALSACWDNHPDGDRADNVEQALSCAQEALALAERLPVDRLAEASMEVGLLYIRRPGGDLASNLALARSSLDRAATLANGSSLGLLATFNRAAVDVEDDLDRSGQSLDMGIAKLRILAHPQVMVTFDPGQQQNLLQTLAGALAKRASGRADVPAAELDEAADLMARAHVIARDRGHPFEAARLASLRARIETDRQRRSGKGEDLLGILALIDEAAQVFTAEAAPYDHARNEIQRAGVLRDLADPLIGEPLATLALEDAARVLTPDGDPDTCRRVQSTLGRTYARRDDWARAARAYETACQASERILAGTESPGRRLDEVEPNAELHAHRIEALVRQLSAAQADGQADEAGAWAVLEAMEHGRARFMLDLMGLRPLPPQAGVPRDWIQQEAGLIQRLRWTLPTAELTRSAPVAAQQLMDLRAARAALEDLWDRIAATGEGGRRHVAMRRASPPHRADLADLQTSLGARTACLCFFVLPSCVVAAWMGPAGAPVVRVIDADAQGLREALVEPFERDVLADEPPAHPTHAWQGFGETLFGPFKALMASIEGLVLVPHAALHGLPLHALSLDGQPLIDARAVSYAPSLGVLAAVRAAAGSRADRGAPFVGSFAEDPDDRAEFEAEAQAVATRLRAVPRRQVSGATLRAAVSTAPLIHVACHGAFDIGDPLKSGVSLADGVLSAGDLLSLHLCCDIATLSACETGRQAARQGDELLGLARALLQAGSASVLLALWRVYSDSTLSWMQLFYAALVTPAAQRPTRAEAFRTATLALRAKDPDPRAWAAFMLTGDPG